MTSRSAYDTSTVDILALITEFYCGLTVKKDMQNISCQIRQFVMMNEKIKNKDQIARRILDFFLKIEEKLIKKTDKQWDNVFQSSIARAQALLRICEFPNHHLQKYSFRMMKIFGRIQHHSERKSLCSFRTEQVGQQYNSIQVQKDIKLKTFYFFKWCQYIQKSKMVKQLKNRQIDNQKISLSFNKYGLKFNYFIAWKKFYKKQKLQRERAKTISNKYKNNLLKRCMNAVIQISCIVRVEHQIQSKTLQKIIEYKKKILFKKLKINNKIIKNCIRYKKFNNIKAFQFIKQYQQRFKPLMNKSYKLARQKFQKQLEKAITYKYFNQLIKLNKDRKDKQKRLLEYRRNNLFLSWRTKYLFEVCFKNRQTQLSTYLYKIKRNRIFTILNFNKLVREQQFNKLESMRQNPLTNKNFIEISIKKQIEQKKKKLDRYIMRKLTYNLIIKLKKYEQDCCNKQILNKNTRILCLKRMLNRYILYKRRLEQKQKYYQNLNKKHEKKILYYSFKRLRRIKYYQKIQQDNIKILEKCFTNIAVKQFWNKFLYRLRQKQSITKLVHLTTKALIKLAYLRIQGRTIIINQNIRVIRKNKDRKLMSNLFNLLIRNQTFNAQRALDIQKYQGKRCQKLLIKKLKQMLNFKNKSGKVAKVSQNRRKIQFLRQLKQDGIYSKKLLEKTQKVSKSAFIRLFKKSVQQNIRIQQKINEKASKIQESLIQQQMNRFIRLLKYNRSSKQSIELRKQKILFKISREAILKIKQIYQNIKSNKKIKLQQKIFSKKCIIDTIKVLGLQNKYKKFKINLQQIKLKSAIKDLKQLCLKSSKIKKCSLLQQQKIFITWTSQFYTFLIKQKQQADDKMFNIQQTLNKSTKDKMKYFFTLSRNNKQNNYNSNYLLKQRKSKLFSEFIAMSLRSKFYRIKFNCSLKFYAKNLMKKGLKSLKNLHMKIKQKQNMQRIDRNSSIMIEKSIQKSFKSNTLSQQIQRFNLRKSRQIR